MKWQIYLEMVLGDCKSPEAVSFEKLVLLMNAQTLATVEGMSVFEMSSLNSLASSLAKWDQP